LRNALAELMDRAPGKNFEARIRQIAAETAGVDGVEKCMARKMGYEYLVDLHVEVNPQMTVQAGHEIAHQVKDKIREQLPTVRDVLVHVEPSGRKPRHSG
jgi:divalent metal cation (Fe/Co/Zn/Cd) transporter